MPMQMEEREVQGSGIDQNYECEMEKTCYHFGG